MEWVSRITTVALEMVIPGLLGLWADSYFQTKFVVAIVGFVLGFAVAMRHLLRMTAAPKSDESLRQDNQDSKRP